MGPQRTGPLSASIDSLLWVDRGVGVKWGAVKWGAVAARTLEPFPDVVLEIFIFSEK